MNPGQGGWVILLTVVLAMLAAIVHLPESWPAWLGWWRPVWVPLVLFFWVVEVPHRVGLIVAWMVGLCLDVLVADPLGVNGALLACLTFVTWRFYERLRMFAVLQQSLLLLVLLGVYELLRASILAWVRGDSFHWAILLGPVLSAFLWPFLYMFLQRLRTGFRVT